MREERCPAHNFYQRPTLPNVLPHKVDNNN